MKSRVIFVFQTQRYEEEKRSLSREIFTLNKHLMEANVTIQKLREDNVRTVQKHTTLDVSIIPQTRFTGSGPLSAGSQISVTSSCSS